MKYTIYLSGLLFCLLFAYGCPNDPSGDSTTVVSTVESSAPQVPLDNKQGEANPSNPNASTLNLKLIKKGSLAFQSDDLEKTYQEVKDLVKNFDAYVSNENFIQNDYRNTYSLTIRIPQRNFDTFLSSMDAGVGVYDERKIEVKDVSEEYLDLEIRLENQKALAKRYRELLNKASNMNEIVKLETELRKISTEVDRISGRLRYLSNRVSFSTLKVRFYKDQKVKPKNIKNEGFWSRAGQGLANGWKMIEEVFIVLLSIWPLMIVFTLIGIWFYRNRQKEKADKS